MSDYFGKEIPKLGFGLMRLPKLDDGKTIDIEQVKVMTDKFMAAGQSYFDTAFVYDNGGSEEAAREALVKRYPRESFKLATKLNAWMQCRDEESAKKQFYTSLERTGAGYFDFYLLHAFMLNNYEKYDKYHLWDFARELKAKGLVKHWGFSFHATPELLDHMLTQHPDVDFVQLQINYMDWENPEIASRANYEVARRHGKSIIVMEPVKGGTLANPPEEVKKVFRSVDPNASMASWAIRFAASLDGIISVLSGMSNIEQMEDNLSYMQDFRPLNDEEWSAVQKAQEILGSSKKIPCTACHYCTDGCPMNIPIPEIFTAMNKQLGSGQLEAAKSAYREAVADRGAASDCIRCGQCENACPQGIKVIAKLSECAAALE